MRFGGWDLYLWNLYLNLVACEMGASSIQQFEVDLRKGSAINELCGSLKDDTIENETNNDSNKIRKRV